MPKQVTIVMYHYVRALGRSRYPAIKGLDLSIFRQHLDLIAARFTPIRVEDLVDAAEGRRPALPEDSILLTFDDGYLDHFTNVFPLLDARGIQGAFFPPVRAIEAHEVLDVNKIHFVLAAAPDPAALLDRILAELRGFAPGFLVDSKEAYLHKIGGDHRFDPPEVVVIKRLLQRELPEAIRREMVARLFREEVTEDEESFASELYMSKEQISCLLAHGMHVGSHGYSHGWLNHMSRESQIHEIDRSLEFLRGLGLSGDAWSICYPYGGFNDSVLEVARSRGCRLGFGVQPRKADLATDERLALPRIDANDLTA